MLRSMPSVLTGITDLSAMCCSRQIFQNRVAFDLASFVCVTQTD